MKYSTSDIIYFLTHLSFKNKYIWHYLNLKAVSVLNGQKLQPNNVVSIEKHVILLVLNLKLQAWP